MDTFQDEIQMNKGHETELKLICTPDDLAKVKVLPLLKAALSSADGQRLVSTYFDTPDRCLWKSGMTLRVRQTEQGLVQTLKQQKPSALNQGEWENSVSQNLPDINAVKKTPIGSWFRKRSVRERLQEVFEVNLKRFSATLDLSQSLIEIAINEGVVESQGTSVPVSISELELELKQGEKAVLFELARTFSQQSPLQISLISKAERGYVLAEGLLGHSTKATQPQLYPNMDCGEAFEAICRCCLHDFMKNIDALETTDRVEAVHQGRVAIRRLRAGLRFFRPVAGDDAYQNVANELKWISDVLGEARDLDVLQDKTFFPASQDTDFVGGKELAEYMETRRNAAHEVVNEAVKSEHLRVFLVDLLHWVEEGNWRRDAQSQISIEEFARPRLKKQRKKLVKQTESLAELDPLSRHKIRIKAKKLRYVVEFFKGLPEISGKPKGTKRLLRSLEKLQKYLGRIHDGEAKIEFLQKEVQNLQDNANHIAAFAAGVLAGAPVDTRRHLKRSIGAYWKLVKANPF